MYAKLKSDKVIIGKEAASQLVNYGREKRDTIELSLEEAAFLIEREKIDVIDRDDRLDFERFIKKASQISHNFELKYIVYKDLRERGYYLQPGSTDFRVYPRGGGPGETPAEYFVHVISEREPLELGELSEQLKMVENVRKRMILAIVDEESDITFYEVKLARLRGDEEPFSLKVKSKDATLIQDRVIIWDEETSNDIFDAGFFGKLLDEKRLQLSLVEAAYLIKNGIIKVVDLCGNELSLEDFVEGAIQIEPDFNKKFDVYKDLREKSMTVKTGFKFGTHFRVYDARKNMHSRYLVHAITPEYVFSLPEMSRAIRLAHSVRKRMLFAYKRDGKIEYIDIGRLKL
ncbi:MAG: tRNA-intron lyase [Halobacteriota archaeon]|nr:tRNA-intron lyase [Halobacteriota archaeon]